MCGIAGFFRIAGHDSRNAGGIITRMTESLRHRGPDEKGFFVDEYVALGHRRLSIIDLSQGQQPMAADDGRLQIVFNGEIYNFAAIRNELEKKGALFHSCSDTEVILQAYRVWGKECLEKFNGMFAFALWDRETRTLFAARDRVGKKPFYYYWDGQLFVFASEIKALLQTGFVPSTIDYRALDCYFSFGYIPAPMTIFSSVSKLPPAHSITVSAKDFVKERYWNLDFHDSSSKSDAEILDEFQSILDDAVAIRLVSEVPLGAFLSGGLDSTLVVSSMAATLDHPVLTNSIGFRGDSHDELPIARLVAEYLHTDHREFIVQPNVAAVLEDIAWYFDEPFADSSAVPTWYVCKMARESVTVALSGDGGDENFGGYTFRYIPHLAESRIRAALPLGMRRHLFGPLGRLYPASSMMPRALRLKTIFENLALSDAQAFYRDLIWLRPDIRNKVYRKDFLDVLKGYTPFEEVRSLYESSHAFDPLSRALYTDINLYMTDNCLVKVDRMSMAHSLEVRSPLLDYRLMEFAASLPVRFKIRGRRGKVIFRHLAAQRLPPEILALPKKGFAVPAAKWLREDLRPMVEDVIMGDNTFVSTVLDVDELRVLWKEHQGGHRDHNVFFWGTMMLELWSRHYQRPQ